MADDIVSAGASDVVAWKESSLPPDSSSSETGKETPPEAVHFTVGDGSDDTVKPVVREKGIVRCHSQDTNMSLTEDRPVSPFLSKSSFSDNSLDTADRTASVKAKKMLKDLSTVVSMDDETLSTDSNSTADNDELKRRRRKLHFPAFRKNKSKLS